MNMLLWALLGAGVGLLATVLVFRQLMRRPSTRVLVVNWLNWGSAELPPHAKQLVRHGKWIARFERKPK